MYANSSTNKISASNPSKQFIANPIAAVAKNAARDAKNSPAKKNVTSK